VDWTIQDFGALGEILGAIGVIVSLGYLGLQIRNQNRESRKTSMNAILLQWNEHFADIARNSELASIWVRGIQDDELTVEERSRFWAYLSRYFKIMESLYLQHLDKDSDERFWGGMQGPLEALLGTRGARLYFETRSHWYCQEFRELIEGRIATLGEVKDSLGYAVNREDRETSGQ
jgi:hypothetical protein